MNLLTKRDEFILETLNNYGFLSTNQLIKICFKKVRKTTALRRLRILRNSKWIKSYPGSFNAGLVWALETKALKKLGTTSKILSFNRNSLVHDLKVNDTRLALESLGLQAHWISGHSLRTKYNEGKKPSERDEGTIPDWLLSAKTVKGPKTIALEIELNFKGTKRMERIINLYQGKSSIHQLWYIVPSATMGKKLCQLANRHYREPEGQWFWWSLIQDLDTEEKLRIFMKKKVFNLENIFQLKAAQPPAQEVSREKVSAITRNSSI